MVFRFDDFEIDVDAYEIRRAGKRIPTEPQVFELVRYLLEHRDRLVMKDELLDKIWQRRFVTDTALMARIKAARRVLGDNGRAQRVIQTVHGRGYRFVAALKEVDQGLARQRPGTASSELLERSEAFALLDEALADAARGTGRVVLVTGEAGIGKTSVVRAFSAHAAGRARVYFGACDDLATPRPLGPLHDLDIAADSALALALQSPVPGQVQRALLGELGLDPAPSLLVIEDVHWADEATIDVLTGVSRRLGRLPAVLVLTFRDNEVLGPHPLQRLLAGIPADQSRPVRLVPLSADAVATLVGPSRAAEAMAITGGVPFFVTELAAMDPDEGIRTPRSVGHAVLARVGRLPAATRGILELLAVNPTRTDIALLDLMRPRWAEEIEAAERAAIVSVDGAAVSFRHELARRAMLDAMPVALRRRLHLEIAGALASIGADPARVVHHAEAGGDAALLLEQARLAARRASAASAHREAWSHYQRVLPLLDRLDAKERAAVLEAASREAYATGDAAMARDLATRSLHKYVAACDRLAQSRLHRWISRIHWLECDGPQARAHANLAIAVLDPPQPTAELAWACSNQAQLAVLAWRFEEALQLGEKAVSMARRLGARDVLSHALVSLGMVRIHRDLADQQPLWDAVSHAIACGEHHEATRGLVAIAYHLMEGNLPARADEVLDRGIRHAEQFEVETIRQYLIAMRARVALMRGRWDAAGDGLDRVLSSRASVTSIVALGTLALLQLRRGSPDASATLARARAMAEATGEPQRILPLLEADAELAWLAGRLGDARPMLREACAMAAPSPIHRGPVARWLQEAGGLEQSPGAVPEPYAAELEGRWADAAADWHGRGMPYEEACCLARTGPAGRRKAIKIAAGLGAEPLVARLHADSRRQGSGGGA